ALQWTVAKQNQLREALLLDRSDPTLSVGIQIRTLGREHNRVYACRCQRRPKRRAKLLVPIMQNVAASIQIAPTLQGCSPGDLLHPFPVWMPGDPGDRDPSGLQVKKEQHRISHQAPPLEKLPP